MKKLLYVFLIFLISHQALSQVIVLMSSGVDTNSDWIDSRCQLLQAFVNKPIICGAKNDLQNLRIMTDQFDYKNLKIIDVYEDNANYFFRVAQAPTLQSQDSWTQVDFSTLAQYVSHAIVTNENEVFAEKSKNIKTITVLPPAKFTADDLGKMKLDKKTDLKFNVDFVSESQSKFGLLPVSSSQELNPRFTLMLNYKW